MPVSKHDNYTPLHKIELIYFAITIVLIKMKIASLVFSGKTFIGFSLNIKILESQIIESVWEQ